MMLKIRNLLLVFILAIACRNSYGQTKEIGPYLPSPNIVKAAGTWVGVYGDKTLMMNLRVRKRFIATANYSTDFLEGNYALGDAKITSLKADTSVINIWQGHFFDQQKQDVIVCRFRDILKNKEVKMVLRPIAGDDNAYQMSLFNRYIIDRSKRGDTALSVPRSLLLRRIE